MPKNGTNSRAPKKSAPVKSGPKKPHRKGSSAPKAEVATPTRKPRHTAAKRDWTEEKPARGARSERPARREWTEEKPARGARPAKREWTEEKPSRDRRPDWKPGKAKESFAGKQARTAGAATRPKRDWTEEKPARSARPARREWTEEKPVRGARAERPARREWTEEKPARRRDDRPARGRSSDRDPRRSDRMARDESRERTFSGARSKTPNKKAFHEDVVLEKLESVSQEDAIIETRFEEMGLHPRLVEALKKMGAEVPFPIQAATIPAAISGRDVLGRGKTGSGKTIAFSLPIITKLVAGGSQPRKPNRPRALVLAPTRELADQIDRTLSQLAKAVGFYTTCVYGGVPQRRQEIAMQRGVDILVATPGRLEDLMAQKVVDLRDVETLVIDEADHMCDLGFIEPVRRITAATGDSQKMLFSATLDKEIDALVKEFLPKPYVYEVPNETEETSDIVHRVMFVDPDDRSAVLLRLVQGIGKTIIFTRTKMTAERLSESLTSAGVPAARLHGDLNQSQRNRNLQRFMSGEVRVLVATDVAARGIHVDDIAIVLQVDPPEEYKTYLHRSGRTGRAGKQGTVITLVPRSRRRKVEDLLRRAERDAIFTDVKPDSPLLAQIAGPIAPAPAVSMLDFGDSRGGSREGGRGRSDRGSRDGARSRSDRGPRDGSRGKPRGDRPKGKFSDKPKSRRAKTR